MGQRDLTEGPVFQTMLRFALPMILGNLLQQGYHVVDTWVVGRYAGSGALAAVGASFALMTCLTSALLGLCMGSGTVCSICFGKRDEERLKDGICASFLLTAAVAALLTAASLLGVDALVRFMNIPKEISEMTRSYLIYVFWGIPAIALYNFFGAYLKALGNSVVPLAFLGVSTGLNIGLDLLFVARFGLGAAGAAAATALSQYASGIGILAYVQGLVNSFGTAVMAAFAAAVKIDAFTYMPAQEYANAFSTFLAQNVGAKKTERISQGIRFAFLTSISYCLFASLLFWLLAKPLMMIFIDPGETAIVAYGVRYLHTIGPFYCGIGCLFLFYGLYRATGRPMASVALTVISLGTRVGLSYALSAIPAVGIQGIWISIPIGWGLADLAGALYFWKLRRFERAFDTQ